MKFITAVLGICTLALLTFSCERENVCPQHENLDPQGSIEGLQRPTNQCGSSTFTNFVDVSNNPMGTIEVLNTENEVFLLVDMNAGWLPQGAKVFVGNSIDLPKTGGGMIQLEEFPFQFIHSRSQDKSTFRINISSLPACYGVAIYGQAAQLNQFGNVVNTRTMWANGTSILNGRMFNYCSAICTPLGQGAVQNF